MHDSFDFWGCVILVLNAAYNAVVFYSKLIWHVDIFKHGYWDLLKLNLCLGIIKAKFVLRFVLPLLLDLPDSMEVKFQISLNNI